MDTITPYSGELTRRVEEMVAKGRQEAAAFRPPADATRMDQHEAAVQAEAEQWMAGQHQLIEATISDGMRSANEIHQKTEELEARIRRNLAANSVESDVDALLAEERQPAIDITEARMRAQVDLRDFRHRHAITEPARYPVSKVRHYALVLAMGLGETLVNSVFYANDQGLLGGFGVAASVAAVNLSGAVFLGIGYRYSNLRSTWHRVFGWGCLVVFIALALYCNALFATFRTEIQPLADGTIPTTRAAFTAASEAAARVFILGTHFPDLMAFILFGVGLVLSGLAFYKGYTSDDPVPGHGEKDKLVREKKETESECIDGIRNRLKTFLQSRRHELQAIAQEPAQVANQAGHKIAALETGISDFRARQLAIQRDFAMLLKAYRDTNMAIRAANPPQYFAYTPDVQIMLDSARVTATTERLVAARENARRLRDSYQDPLNDKVNAFQSTSATILNERFDAFLRAVEREAQTALDRETAVLEAR